MVTWIHRIIVLTLLVYLQNDVALCHRTKGRARWRLCATVCHCNSDHTVIRCIRANLTTVPTDLPHNIRELNLDGNLISKLDAGILSNASNLKSLSLQSNNISSIHEQAFAGLVRLHSLALDRNGIDHIPNTAFLGCGGLKHLTLASNFLSVDSLNIALRSARQLTTLDLSGNDLQADEFPESVANMTQLKHLYLRNITFTNISAAYFLPLKFTSLHKLDLSLSTVISAEPGAFSYLQYLNQLDISYSQLPVKSILNDLANTTLETLKMKYTYTQPNINPIKADFFQGLVFTKIRYMYLTGNYNGFNRILPSGIFDGLDSLRELYLENCDLISLPSGALRGLRHLEKLHLRFNLFTCTASSSCDGLFGEDRFPNLEQLDLSNNAISTVPNSVRFKGRNYPALFYLGLRNNSIDVITRNLFTGLRSLRYLDLSHNPIHTIEPSSFSDLITLDRLKIADCYALWLLQNGTFTGLTNLTSLRLHNNALSSIEAEAFIGMASLQELHLEHNRLEGNFSSVVINSSHMISINLEDNRLTEIPRMMLAASSRTVLQLNIAFNRIQTCGGAENLRDLRDLDLSHNLITEPTRQCFLTLNQNSSLNLAGNPFYCGCDTHEFTNWLTSTSVKIQRQDHHICASPRELSGHHLFGLVVSDWECGLKAIVIPIITGIASAIFFLVITAIIVAYTRQSVMTTQQSQDHDHSIEESQGCVAACGKRRRSVPRRVSEERLIPEVEDEEDHYPHRLAGEQTQLCNGDSTSVKPRNGSCLMGDHHGIEMTATSGDDLQSDNDIQVDVHYGGETVTEVDQIIDDIIHDQTHLQANGKYQSI